MKHLEELKAVMALMGEHYTHIREIERVWGIRFSEQDLRPRIEHFHDAVRALTSGSEDPYNKHARLSVEYLAYDLAQLRLIQTKPLGSINFSNSAPPTGQENALVNKSQISSQGHLPDQKTRRELVTLYTHYTLLFAALFAPTAEDGFRVRSEQAESQIEDMAIIEQTLKQLIAGSMSTKQAQDALIHVDRDDVREALMTILSKGKISPSDMTQAQSMVTTIKQGLSKEKKAVEQAHTHYTMAQLAIYEASRDMVKQMAAKGLNLAGKFLENATRAAGQSRGR